MDLQRMMDSMNEIARETRAKYHLTLGGLIEFLEEQPHGATCHLCEPHSYRGYYSDLAFSFGEERSVVEVLEEARDCIGRTFKGYKGGDFVMAEDTPLWLASWGTTSGAKAIMGATMEGDKVSLVLKDLEV